MTEPTERTETLDDRVAGESRVVADAPVPRRRRRSAPVDRPPTPLRAPAPGSRDGANPRRLLSGRYLLQQRIASGGMASVWRGTDELLARTVAVKLLHDHLAADDDFRERFRREAISAAKLSHPAIVGLYDTGSDDGQVFIVMEFVDGPTLRDVIARTDGLPPGHAAAIGERVARALDYAHERGLVHRDVKPANILVGNDGAVKVADFGIAKADQADDLTKTGMVLGTAAYVAPEQILARPIDGGADQYALGCVIYEALTGRQPFKAETAVATAAQRLERAAPPLRTVRPDVPAALEAIVVRAMAREPADRFPTTGHLADALAEHADADTARTAALVAPGPAPDSAPAPAATPQPAVAVDTDRGQPTWSAGPPTSEMARADAAQPGGPPRRRGRTALWLVPLVLVLLAGAGVLGAMASGLLEGTATPAPTAAPTAAPTPTAAPSDPVPAAASVALTTADLRVFDPLDPDGEGEEYDELLPALVDGDPGTAWRTEGYDDPDLGKDGVGVVVDLGGTTEVTSVELGLDTPGIEVELRTADTRPADPADTTVVAQLSAARARAVLAPDRPVETRYLVVWITGDLQLDESDDSGRHRAVISSLRVLGRR